MNGSIARRAAIAVSAFAFVVATVTMPATASANGQEPPPAPRTPTPMTIYQPDIQVTSLGIITHADGTKSYSFEVKNVGQGPAKKMQIVKDTTIRNESTHVFLRQDLQQYTYSTPLNGGQKFVVNVHCGAHGPEYCDFGHVGVMVDQVVKDSNGSNNYAVNNDNIKGLKQL
jgi:hypothetical protein